jgi:hypothetical protein
VGAGRGEIDAQEHKNGNGLCEIVQHGLSPRTEQSSDAALPNDSASVIQITFSYQRMFFTGSEAALGPSFGSAPGQAAADLAAPCERYLVLLHGP